VVAACTQKRRVRFATTAALVNELVDAKHQLQLARVLARRAVIDPIALDEVGYVPLAEVGSEFLFQVIPNARLYKALLDRITKRAHIIETGSEFYRFRRTAERRKNRPTVGNTSG